MQNWDEETKDEEFEANRAMTTFVNQEFFSNSLNPWQCIRAWLTILEKQGAIANQQLFVCVDPGTDHLYLNMAMGLFLCFCF